MCRRWGDERNKEKQELYIVCLKKETLKNTRRKLTEEGSPNNAVTRVRGRG